MSFLNRVFNFFSKPQRIAPSPIVEKKRITKPVIEREDTPYSTRSDDDSSLTSTPRDSTPRPK
jgi:hypothetical protein